MGRKTSREVMTALAGASGRVKTEGGASVQIHHDGSLSSCFSRVLSVSLHRGRSYNEWFDSARA